MAYIAYRPFEQAVLDRAERIIATSPPYLEASEPLREWKGKCAVVPLGLGHSALSGLSQPPTENNTVASWLGTGFRLLAIGRLAHYKGFETLVKAVSGMPGVELIIVGEGELTSHLSRLISSLCSGQLSPNVRLVGALPDQQKWALLRSCDVFCLASCERTEAFGMVVLEAMAAGKACIVSDLPGSGLPWLVKDARAGLLADVNDTVSWRAMIDALRRDPEATKAFGVAGSKAFNERFSAAAEALAIQEQYRIACNQIGTIARPPLVTRDLLFVIPAKDEAATIAIVIRKLLAAGWNDVVVIDDHSSDQTGSLARAAGATVLRPILPLGAWGAMQTGIRYGIKHGYRGVVTLDADGQHEVDEIPALLQARINADVVIGAHPERASRLRLIAWAWFRKLSGFKLRDLTSGFRFYNHEAMRIASNEVATLLDYQDLGTLLLIRQSNLSIVEIDVHMNLRAAGKSRIFNSWLSVARYMIVTTILCISRGALKSTPKS
jgi:hypothetical protein